MIVASAGRVTKRRARLCFSGNVAIRPRSTLHKDDDRYFGVREMQMQIKTLKIAIAAASLATVCDVSAMTLSGRGLGQILVFPYYTVNAGQNTLLTLVNSTSDTKALKVRFREAYDGRSVASFNVYLSPYDVWTGTVFVDDSIVAIGTRDNSCTAPGFETTATAANIPALAFSTASFTAANTDGGPTDVSRLYEGNFEIFEMGVIANDGNIFNTDIRHVNGLPPGCNDIAAAWNSGGAWATDPTKSMLPPTGGLFGASGVVNVGEGTYFEILPGVIDGFSTTEQNSAPAANAPDFDTASAGTDGKVAASVDIGGAFVTAHFSNAVDAVSALFMQTQSINEFVTEAGTAETDWVATFPTKRFYVDPAINTSSNVPVPFDSLFQIVAPGYDGESVPSAGSCVPVGYTSFDREESTVTAASCGFDFCGPYYETRTFCHETSVLPLTASGSALKTNLQEILNGRQFFAAGHALFDLGSNSQNHSLVSDDGYAFTGLPVIGFVAENFTDNNVTPGVLANYSAAIPHRSTLTCTQVPSGTACQ